MKIRLGFVANSSSEAFICNTKFSLSEVKEKLEKIVETYNSLFNTNILFDEMFKYPIILDEKDEKTIYIWEQAIGNLKKHYGKIFIESSAHDDNSIPFCLLELIEELFEADRYHC